MRPNRITIRPALTVALDWAEPYYVFRLMVDRFFVTPPLLMDADHMNLLEQMARVDLCDKKGIKWLQLASNRRIIQIQVESRRLKEMGEDAVMAWPDIPYQEFMNAAQLLRGDRPSAGWEKIVEARLDEQRTG